MVGVKNHQAETLRSVIWIVWTMNLRFAKSRAFLKVSLGREKNMDGVARLVAGASFLKEQAHSAAQAGRPISPLSHPKTNSRTV